MSFGRTVAVTAWIIALIVATTWFVQFAAQRGLLIWGAPVLAAAPILGLRWLREREELAGWSLFTVWLGSTYLQSGALIEFVAFGVIVALAIAGFVRSPWCLVVAWLAHIGWDFVPRELPPLLEDLPVACLLFDGMIGCYLALRIKAGRWGGASRVE